MARLSRAILTAIHDVSDTYQIPPSLLQAMIKVESSGDIYAWRVEPHYRWLWNVSSDRPFRALTNDERISERAPLDFPYMSRISSRDTEWWGQQASWGCLQVMGGVAREYGYRGPFPGLSDPRECLNIASSLLGVLIKRHFKKYGWAGVVAAYNAGSVNLDVNGMFRNQVYVDKVTKAGFDLRQNIVTA